MMYNCICFARQNWMLVLRTHVLMVVHVYKLVIVDPIPANVRNATAETNCQIGKYASKLGHSRWNPYTPCGRFTISIPQGECDPQMDWRIEQLYLKVTHPLYNICRLITAYLLLRVNLDKIMHARWDFDASSARTRRMSALDKHQNWSASVLFCLNSRAQSKYTVVNLIHTQHKQTFLSFIM